MGSHCVIIQFGGGSTEAGLLNIIIVVIVLFCKCSKLGPKLLSNFVA